ncbi:hypothetical protein NDU88_009326 [Pleurodeles waltl]|uniref:Receptor ligand binding region domain-containing protein n=1 Tax=Pleurodeles waltl TaxID=8319 RepID=A0AAV7P2Y3_PLEWA|nr:hypothetical protein NDU88_009326 [Pleurodeles waltl]
MVVSNDDVGLQGGESIRRGIEENGGCVAFMVQISLIFSKQKVLQVAEMILGHPVKVIIVHSNEVHVKVLLQTLYSQNNTSKVLIFTASFTITPGLLDDKAWKIFHGSLGLVPFTDHMMEFEAFLYRLRPLHYPNDIFMKLLWEKGFLCKLQDANQTETAAKGERDRGAVMCSGEENLEDVSKTLFELNDMSYTYHSYIAVYAFAHALNTLISCKPGQGPFTNQSCADINKIQAWQILHYLKNLHFKTHTGKEIFFDANGDASAVYDILNVQISQEEEFRLEKIGKLDPTAGEGKEIIINSSAILWSDGSSKVRTSPVFEGNIRMNKKKEVI